MVLLRAACRSLLSPSPSPSRASRRPMSTAAAYYVATGDASVVGVPRYAIEAPVPEITKLDNGVTVVSSYCPPTGSAPSPPPPGRVTVRVSGVGSRHDAVGGESAAFARSVPGGVVGREFVSFPSLATLHSAPARLDDVRASLALEASRASILDAAVDRLHETAYQGSPGGDSLGSPLLGTPESIARIGPEDVRKVAGRTHGIDVVVAGTGWGEHGRLVEDAEGAYGHLPRAGHHGVRVSAKSSFVGSDVRIRYDSHDTATVAIAFAGASHTDPKAMPLALMRAVLGSYSSRDGLGRNVASSMCQEVADHGLASSISAFSLNYTDAGLFGVAMTAPDNKLDDLLWYVMPNLVRLAHGISDEELARAKLALKVSICSSYDGDVALGETMAAQIQTIGRVMSLAEALARVDALTMADVKAAAGEVINDQDHALAAIGGIHELPDYNWIRRHSYMLRY